MKILTEKQTQIFTERVCQSIKDTGQTEEEKEKKDYNDTVAHGFHRYFSNSGRSRWYIHAYIVNGEERLVRPNLLCAPLSLLSEP